MSDPTNHEVVLWFQSRFADFKQRGPVTQKQADAYNRAHPDRPFIGPVKKTAPWSRAEHMAADGRYGSSA